MWDKAKEDRTVEKAIFIDETWQLIGAASNRLAAEFVLEIHLPVSLRTFGVRQAVVVVGDAFLVIGLYQRLVQELSRS